MVRKKGQIIRRGAILARIAIDPGRGGGEGRATLDCLDDELKPGARRTPAQGFAHPKASIMGFGYSASSSTNPRKAAEPCQ
jgi:hypothetical protein